MKKKILVVLMAIALAGTMVTPAMAEETGSAAETPAEEINDGTGFDRIEPQMFEAAHYDIRTSGGQWDGNNYILPDGTLVHDAFFCDGVYTYFLQTDGTPMRDRLTYHPDGSHVIYLDANGHEVFMIMRMCGKVFQVRV